MAEGGSLPWKLQKIDQSRGPAGRYDAVHYSLPDLPDGVAWKQDPETREWTLVRVDNASSSMATKKTIQKFRNQRDELIYSDSSKDREGRSTSPEDGDHPSQPILGQDYLVHIVLPSDTFAGLCLRYKVKPVVLRRVNHFSGTNLSLAPSKLLIPLTHISSLDQVRVQDTSSHEFKMQAILTEYPRLTSLERKAYLEMNDWDVDKTLKQIQQDNDWEKAMVVAAGVMHQKQALKQLQKPAEK